MDAEELKPKKIITSSSPQKQVWFIHGANATPTSFEYLRDKLKSDPDFKDFSLIDIKYNCQENLSGIIKALTLSIRKGSQVYLVGHSLGGIIATAISQRIKVYELPLNIKGVFTISSPFGGSESAEYLQWLYPTYHLFRSIATTSRVITDLISLGAVVPTTSLVTSSGNNPLFSTANDGVVTIRSQRSLKGANYIEINSNHFEVLMNQDTVEHLKVFLKNT